MRRLFAVLLLLAACRTQPLDFDGGFPGADLAGGASDLSVGGRDLAVGGRDFAVGRDLHGTPTSCCGVVGNPGNELGVGKFCLDALDCQSTPAAKVCVSQLHFCTKTCTPNGPPSQCGSGAMCQCAGAQCACIPGECTMPPPGC
jgi:hypothetical protein